MKYLFVTPGFYEDVAEAIKRRGWTQGQFRAPSGEVCIYGGANLVAEGSATKPVGPDLGRAFAWGLGFKNTGVMIRWNDLQTRTEADVIDRLMDAAKRLRTKSELEPVTRKEATNRQ